MATRKPPRRACKRAADQATAPVRTAKRAKGKPAQKAENAVSVPIDEVVSRLNKAVEDENHEEIEKALTDGKTQLQPNHVQNAFTTAFRKTMKDKKYACVEAFMNVKLKFNPNTIPMDGQFAIFEAIDEKDKEMVRILCKKPFQTKSVRLGSKTPLHLAAELGDVEITEALLGCGYDPNSGFHFGTYPLHLSIEGGHSEVAKRLLAAGAKPNAVNGVYYEKYEGKQTPLMLAVVHNLPDIVDILLKRKINLEVRDWFKETALYKAVITDNVTMTRKLIERGADPDAIGTVPYVDGPHQEEYGHQPLFIAVEHQNVKMVKLLLDTKKVDLSFICGMLTCLDWALCQKGQDFPKIARMLIEAGSDVNATNLWNNYMNSFHHFANTFPEENHEQLMLMLTDYCDNISEPDTYKNLTPLQYAMIPQDGIDEANLPIAKWLIQVNCDLKLVGSGDENRSLIETAARRRLVDIIRMLVESGYKVDKPNDIMPDDAELQSWLHHSASAPFKLKLLCRIAIREMLGRPIVPKLRKLELPLPLKEYLMMKEYGGIDYNLN